MEKETKYFYKYSFKMAAANVANHPEIQTKAVAEALNVHPFMLSRWKKQLKEILRTGRCYRWRSLFLTKII
jgi:hypothetical protein